jgi:7-carboxy-7-deazaguanine synthase
MENPLKVHEVYLSLQGEGTRTGLPCVLVRLAGCNLHCTWCDTLDARDPGSGAEMSIDDILAQVEPLGCKRVELTGGEPLCQTLAPSLLTRFCDDGYEVLLETNGSLPIDVVDSRVIRIVDVKCPSSGEDTSFHLPNLDALRTTDELKFVLAGRNDYEFARDLVAKHDLIGRCEIIFSPVAMQLTPPDLARWILDDGIDVRLGLQLHKILWPNAEGGV